LDSSAYKLGTSQPDVFRSSELTNIASILKDSEPELFAAFNSAPRQLITRPDLHNGSTADDYYQISISADIASEIAEALLVAEAMAVSPEGHTTSKASQIASLLDRWSRYTDFVCQ
jgi:hypothetical protein